MAVTIDIYGSCVSKDLLRYTGIGKYKLSRCVTQVPLTSLYERPVHLQEGAIAAAGFSKSEQALLRLQSERILPRLLKKNKAEYLIIDLADELMRRYNVMIGDAEGHTTQLAVIDGRREAYGKLFETDPQYSLIEIYAPAQLDQLRNEKKYRKFAQDILYSEQNPDGYRPEQVIILEAMYAQNILTRDGSMQAYDESYQIRESNAWLQKQYTAFERAMKGCHIIRFPDFVHGSPFHKYGTHPLHYMSENYAYFERALDVAVRYSDVNTLENLWKEQSLQNKIQTRAVNSGLVYDLQKQIKALKSEISRLETELKP